MATLNTPSTSENPAFIKAAILVRKAYRLTSQPESVPEGLAAFAKALQIYESILADPTTSPMKLERCKTAIQEITAQLSTIEPNSSLHQSSEGDSGVVYREICSLNLVSCYSLSKGHAPTLVTSGSIEPLRLYVRNEPEKRLIHVEAYPSAFLQITAEDAYPLGADIPVLKAQFGYYIFLRENQDYYGLVFPQGYPEKSVLEFEQLLASICILCAEDENGQFTRVSFSSPEESSLEVSVASEETEDKVWLAESITNGAAHVTRGIHSASNFIRKGIDKAGSSVASKVYRPGANTEVPKAVKIPVTFVKTSVTPGMVMLSSAAATKLANIVGDIGCLLAKGASSIVPQTESSFFSGRKAKATAAVCKASVGALGSIWDELTAAGKNLIDGTEQATVKVVIARHGEEMGSVTGDLFGIGNDLFLTYRNIDSAPIKALTQGAKGVGEGLAERESRNSTHSALVLTGASEASKKGLPASKATLPTSEPKIGRIPSARRPELAYI